MDNPFKQFVPKVRVRVRVKRVLTNIVLREVYQAIYIIHDIDPIDAFDICSTQFMLSARTFFDL